MLALWVKRVYHGNDNNGLRVQRGGWTAWGQQNRTDTSRSWSRSRVCSCNQSRLDFISL